MMMISYSSYTSYYEDQQLEEQEQSTDKESGGATTTSTILTYLDLMIMLCMFVAARYAYGVIQIHIEFQYLPHTSPRPPPTMMQLPPRHTTTTLKRKLWEKMTQPMAATSDCFLLGIPVCVIGMICLYICLHIIQTTTTTPPIVYNNGIGMVNKIMLECVVLMMLTVACLVLMLLHSYCYCHWFSGVYCCNPSYLYIILHVSRIFMCILSLKPCLLYFITYCIVNGEKWYETLIGFTACALYLLVIREDLCDILILLDLYREHHQPVIINDFCPICQDDIISGVTLPCYHSFCYNCIMVWFHVCTTCLCPLCRRQVMLK